MSSSSKILIALAHVLFAAAFYFDTIYWVIAGWIALLAYFVAMRLSTRKKRRFRQESNRVSAIVTAHPVSSELLMKHFDYTSIAKTNWSTLKITDDYYRKAGIVENSMRNAKLSKEDKEPGMTHIEKLATIYAEQLSVLHPECDPRAALQRAIDESIAM